jgi:hypothetical protein
VPRNTQNLIVDGVGAQRLAAAAAAATASGRSRSPVGAKDRKKVVCIPLPENIDIENGMPGLCPPPPPVDDVLTASGVLAYRGGR